MRRWVVLILTIIFWGLAFTAIKYSVLFISPLSVAALRFGIADLLFAVNILFRRRIEWRDIPKVFLLGLFGVTVYHISLNTGEIYVSSGVASIIIALAPIFVLILSWAFLREEITPTKVMGTLIAFVGVAIISEPSSANLYGIALVLISTIAAAIYTTFGKSLMSKYDSITLTSNAMILGSVPLYPFLLISFSELLSEEDTALLASVAFLGIFSTYLGYLGWYYFLETEEASRASVFLLAIPVVSLLAGYFLLNETLTIRTFVGSATVIVGIYLVLRKKQLKNF